MHVVTQRGRLTMTCMWSHTERQADNDVHVVTQRGRLTMTCMWSHREAG